MERCNGNSCLIVIRKALHDIFLRYSAFLCWRRLPHEGRRIWHETVRVHLREIDSCMLTWAGENDDSEEVDQLGNLFNWRRNAMVTFTFPDWITVFMEIKNPCLQLWVLSKEVYTSLARSWEYELANKKWLRKKYVGYLTFIGMYHTSELPWLCECTDWLA